MALVTEPIALDKSLNTTEQISRNIADVLAEELSAIITAIGGLNFINFDVVQELPTTGISTTTIYLVPSDDPQSGNTYDEYINLNGTVSGWEKIGSTDIDLSGYYTSAEVDALLADKADVSDIPTVNDGTLTIQQNGETKGTFTANQSGNSIVNIDIPTTDIQTAVDEFETYNGGLLSECIIELVPVQSGSGDPYPAGGGKNKFGGFVYSVTQDGITASFDGSGKITLQGTASTSTYIPDRTIAINNGYVFALTAGTYTISTTNIPSQARIEVVKTDGTSIKIGDGSFTLTESTTIIVRLFITSGAVISNPITVDIQLEVGSTATDWSSYSNVRPISGHTQVDVGDDGKNLCSGIESGTWTTSTQSKANSTDRGRVENIVSVKPSTSYTINAKALSGKTIQFIAQYYSGLGSGTFISESSWSAIPFTFTTPSNCKYLAFIFRTSANDGNPESYVEEVQLELGSTATAYVPYNGYQVTVNLGGTYYWLRGDVVSGKWYVVGKSVDLGILNWRKQDNIFETNSPISDIVAGTVNAFCEIYEVVDILPTTTTLNSVLCVTNSKTIRVADSNHSDATEFKSALSGVLFVYELATPTPIQLSPTMVKALVGENHLSAPLEGQEITESKYKKMFTFDDVIAYIQSLS